MSELNTQMFNGFGGMFNAPTVDDLFTGIQIFLTATMVIVHESVSNVVPAGVLYPSQDYTIRTLENGVSICEVLMRTPPSVVYDSLGG